MERCKIEEVHCDNPPFLANFECSLPSNNRNLDVKIFENKNKLQVAVASENCIYTNHIQQNDNENLCRTLIAVKKKNNKVFLHEIKPIILSVAKKIKDNKENSIDETIQNNIKNLSKEFGSKKTKRLVEQRERMKVNIDVVEKYLNDTITEINERVNKSEQESFNLSNVTTVYEPIINRNAKSVQEVYNLHDYLTPSDLNEFKSEAKKILEGTYDDINCQCLYIKEEIARIQSKSCSYSENDKILRISILLYSEYIFRFYKSQPKDFNKKSYELFSNKITKKIFDLFTIPSSKNRLRPHSMRYKCICYMLVLFLMVSDRYLIDIEDIGSKLSVSLKNLKDLAKVVGARPSTSSSRLYEVRLPLPEIKLPKAKVGGKK